MSDRTITRRDVVRGGVGAALGATILGNRRMWGEEGGGRSRVVVVRDDGALDESHGADSAVVAKMVSDAVTRVTGKPSATEAWRSLVTPDDIVGLVNTDHLNPTHEEVIDAVRASLVEAGVPAGNVRMAQGGPSRAAACTALIALPALKAHWLTGIGTVLKNYIMFSGSPSSYHREDSAKLGEIWLLPEVKGKTRLVLVDALRPLCDKGPQVDPRYLWDYKGLIAGTDPVAVEAVALAVIELKRNQLKGEPWPLSPPPLCVAAADTRYKLGHSRLADIDVEKVGWSGLGLL